MKLDLTLDAVLAARKIITDKLTIAINQPTGIDEGRYANLLADVKALDEIAAPLIEAKETTERKARNLARIAEDREALREKLSGVTPEILGA
jgi:hypothetical protein